MGLPPFRARREYVKRGPGSRRIEGPGRRPRAAAGDPPERLPASLPGAVLADRPLAVVAAGGLEAALDAQAPHPRRERRRKEVDGAEQAAGRELVAGCPRHVEPQQEREAERDDRDLEPAAADFAHREQLSAVLPGERAGGG